MLRDGAAQVWEAIERFLARLKADDWSRPTPCVGWTVQDVAAHLGHIEGMLVHGFPQPEPPPNWEAPSSPLDQITNLGVDSRRSWSKEAVIDEVERAARATRDLLASPGLDWEAEAPTPIGPAPRWTAVEMRVNDLVVHLLDLRTALGWQLREEGEEIAEAVAVGRAVRLTPWAFVKRASAREGQSLDLSLAGPGGGDHHIVVEQGRAVEKPGDGEATATIVGSGLSYLVAATGRHAMVAAAGGLATRGDLARRLLAAYRLVG